MKTIAAVCFTGLGLATLGFVGCANNGDARRIDPQGTETITTVGELDIQDALDASGTLAESLLRSGKLGREDGSPSTVVISNYRNNTGQQIDRDEIMKKIRVILNQSGQAQFFTALGPAGTLDGAEDSAAANIREAQDVETNPAVNADYTMTYKLMREQKQRGKTWQVTYTFQMSLNNPRTGLAIWEEETMVTKQGNKSRLGW